MFLDYLGSFKNVNFPCLTQGGSAFLGSPLVSVKLFLLLKKWHNLLSVNFMARLNNVKLLNSYDDQDEAKIAASRLVGDKRLASERDATVVIYNLFGLPSWGNLYRLEMYNLPELEALLACRSEWQYIELARHVEILNTLSIVAKNYAIEMPSHWL